MDWKRAKNILIVVFIILNLVLTYILYQDNRPEQVSEQTITNTVEILKQNKIHLERPIPTYCGIDYRLQYEMQELNKKKIATVLLGDKFEVVNDSAYTSGAKSLIFLSDSSFEFIDNKPNDQVYIGSEESVNIFLKDIFGKLELPFLKEFKLDYNYSGKTSVKLEYKGLYEGRAVFDNYIQAEVTKQGITKLIYNYKKPIDITPREDISVIPAHKILITKIANMSEMRILNLDIGFKGYTNVDKTQTKTLYEGLAWRIRTTEGKEYYFKASNGEQME